MKKTLLALSLVAFAKLTTAQTFFNPAVSYSTGTNSFGVVTADFNGDGKTDMASANFITQDISVLINTGTGTFAPAVNYTLTNKPWDLVAADFNGDGKTDIAAGSTNDNNISVLINNGNGTFAPAVTYAAGNGMQRATAADFNGDGHIDIALTNQGTNSVSVLLNSGTGTFPVAATYPVGNMPNDVVSADFNGDNKIDLATANGSDNTITVLYNAGAGTFTTQGTYTVGGLDPTTLALGDFDNDGKTDIASANFNSNNVSILLNTVGFSIATTYTVGNASYALAAADIDGDGHTDIATADYNNNAVSVLLNLGANNYTVQATTYTVGVHPADITPADFNGDGKIDLVTANCGATDVSVLNSFLPGAALNFDGADDFVSIPDNPALSITGDITIETWFKTTGSPTSEQYLVTKNENSFYVGLNVNGAVGQVSFYLDGVSTAWLYSSSTNLNDNNWHHVACTYDGALMSIYIDGVLENLAPNTGNIATGTENVYLGSRDNGFFFQGSMDEFRIWNRALCTGEIQNNMTGEIAGNTNGLVAYYKFNQGTQKSDNTAITNLNDATPNALTGTLNNFALTDTISNFVAPGAITPGHYATPFVNPSITITGNNLICLGANTSTTLTASGTSTYLWSSNANSVTTASVSITPSSTDTYTVTGATNGCLATATVTVTVSTMPTVTVSANPIYVCAGGNSQLSVVDDGSQTLSYVWSPATFLDNTTIANPLASAVTSTTNYSVATSNTDGCAVTNTVTIYAGVALNASASMTPATTICAGTNDTLHVTSTGGGSPYTFAWTGPNSFTSTDQDPALTTITTAQNGIYSVDVTDNCGATVTSTITLVVNALPNILTASGSSHTCEGGTAVYNVTSDNPSTDIYQWNWVNVSVPAVDSVVLGLYSESGYTTNSMTISPVHSNVWGPSGTWGVHCTVTNTAGCTAESVIDTLFINPLPNVPVGGGSICLGQSFTITPMAGISYTVNGGNSVITPTATASYSVTGTDGNGCVSSPPTVITVTVNPLPTVSVNSGTICAGTSFTIQTTTNATAATYSWSTSQTTPSIVVTPTVDPTSYTVTVFDGSTTCTNTAVSTVNAPVCIGIQNYTATNNLQVYPNPFTNELTITSTAKANAILFDMLGNKINEFVLQNTTQTISLESLTPGMYYLQVDNSKIKIIKQ